jgi:hypothetical protein
MSRQARPRRAVRPRKPSAWFEVARRAARELPGVAEHAAAAGPVFRLGRRRLAWLAEDGVSLVVPIEEDERAMLVAAEPRTFSPEAAGRGTPLVRIHLAYVDAGTLARLLAQGAAALTAQRKTPQRKPTGAGTTP